MLETNWPNDTATIQHHDAASQSTTTYQHLITDTGNMLKAFIGLNFMYTAYAFSKAGLVRGCLGLLAITLLTEHCCILLVRVKNSMPDRLHRAAPPTYGDIARFAGGKSAENVVNLALVLTQFGYCVAYLIFISQTIHDIFHSTAPVWMFVLIPLPFLSALAMLRSIRSLGPFSLTANVALLVGFVAVVSFIAGHFQWAPSHPPLTSFPLFFGQMTAALEGIGLVIPVETSMSDPRRFPFVLRIALVILTTVLMVVGVMGFVTFGADTHSILLLNFGQTPVVLAVKCVLIIGILFTYPLQIIPVFQFAESFSKSDDDMEMEVLDETTVLGASDDDEAVLSETVEQHNGGGGKFISNGQTVCVRLAIVLVTAFVAISAGASFGLFLSFVGSLGGSCLAYSAPAWLHYVTFKGEMGRLERAKDVSIFAFGIVAMTVGCITSMWEMMMIHAGESTPS